jgi:aminopeptidase N
VWYSQSGTPLLTVDTTHDAAAGTYTLRFQQTIPTPAGAPAKLPCLIPVRMALLGGDGAALPLQLRGSGGAAATTETVLRVTQADQTFVFEGVGAGAIVPSLLRGFSAPVKMTINGLTDAHLGFLLAHDTDPFNRYEAGQVLGRKTMLALYAAAAAPDHAHLTIPERCTAAGGLNPQLVSAFRALLLDDKIDGQFKAFAISLPAESELLSSLPQCDPVLLFQVRVWVVENLARLLRDELSAAVAANDDAPATPYEFSAAACARRALKNKALAYLATLSASGGDARIVEDLTRRVIQAANMTDEQGALSALDLGATVAGDSGAPIVAAYRTALAQFGQKWAHNPLVMLKWYATQAQSNVSHNVTAVRAVMNSPQFQLTNPNSCYHLFLAFARSAVNFHAADGSVCSGGGVLRVGGGELQLVKRKFQSIFLYLKGSGCGSVTFMVCCVLKVRLFFNLFFTQGYEFMADAVLAVDKINPQVASRVVSAFASWRQYDAARGALMCAQLQRIVGMSEQCSCCVDVLLCLCQPCHFLIDSVQLLSNPLSFCR